MQRTEAHRTHTKERCPMNTQTINRVTHADMVDLIDLALGDDWDDKERTYYGYKWTLSLDGGEEVSVALDLANETASIEGSMIDDPSPAVPWEVGFVGAADRGSDFRVATPKEFANILRDLAGLLFELAA